MSRLVVAGADTKYYPSGTRPTLFKVGYKSPKIKYLLDNGADVNVSFNNQTFLHKAVLNKRHSTIALLLKYRPENRCLSEAIATQDNAIIQLILASSPPVEQLNNGLAIAIQMCDEATAQLIIGAGADVNSNLLSAARLYAGQLWGEENEEKRKKTDALHNIILSLCQRGAWNPRIYASCKTLCPTLVDALLFGLYKLSHTQSDPTSFYKAQLKEAEKYK